MPLVVLGAAAGTVGLILVYRGFLLRLDESFCNVLGNGLPSDPPEDRETVRSRCSKGSGTMLLTGLGLTLVSIPLVVIGARRVPDVPPARVALLPMAIPKGAGVGVRLEL